MKHTYLHTLILYCLKRIKGERSIYAIYHLLKGKKSSQTIQDAHLFDLTKLFGVYPRLKRKDLDVVIHFFQKNDYIRGSENSIVLTAHGEHELLTKLETNPIPVYLNGWKYHQFSIVVWKRLTLLVQVCSNLIHNNINYIPVQKDRNIQLWLKKFLSWSNIDRNELAHSLYQELIHCLEQDEEIEPSILVIRLSGYNQIGLIPIQAAEVFKMDPTLYHIQFLNVLHSLIFTVQTKLDQYPLLHHLISDIGQQIVLTNSAEKTYQFLQAGYSIEQISSIRNLKRNTIEDHIVEIALNVEGFQIAPFVDENKQRRILQAYEKANSKQLKVIRALVEDASYFDIRLVLAKRGE